MQMLVKSLQSAFRFCLSHPGTIIREVGYFAGIIPLLIAPPLVLVFIFKDFPFYLNPILPMLLSGASCMFFTRVWVIVHHWEKCMQIVDRAYESATTVNDIVIRTKTLLEFLERHRQGLPNVTIISSPDVPPAGATSPTKH